MSSHRHLPITALLIIILLPAGLNAQSGDSLAPPPGTVDFMGEGEVVPIDRESLRQRLQRTDDRLRQADLALRVYIRNAMEDIMQGHQEGFAMFENWYRQREARLRAEAAQREVVARICSQALGLGLNFVIPGSGAFVTSLRQGLSAAYGEAASRIGQFEGGNPDLFLAEQRQAIERIRSAYLARADRIADQQPAAFKDLKWEYVMDADNREDTSSDLSPRMTRLAAHYGIPAPGADTIERTRLTVLENHIRVVFESDREFLNSFGYQTNIGDIRVYVTAHARTHAYRHAYPGQPERYCPVELDFFGYGFLGATRECQAWERRSGNNP